MDDLASGASVKLAAHVANTRYEDLLPAVIHAYDFTSAIAGIVERAPRD